MRLINIFLFINKILCVLKDNEIIKFYINFKIRTKVI